MSFTVRSGSQVEKLDDAVLVYVPGRQDVFHLTGRQAQAFALAEAGASTVPDHLATEMAGLVELGVVETDAWSRRRVLQLGGAAAATTVAVVALPGVAAASSTTTTLPPAPTIIEERASNFPTYRIQVSGGPAIGRIIDTTTPGGSGLANVRVVTGLVAGTNRVSFREVDSSGNFTSPALYLAPVGANYSNPASSALPASSLSFQPVPTGATESATFGQLATYTQISPGNNTGVTGGHSFQSIVDASYYLRHASYVLRVQTGSGPLFNSDSTFTTYTA